jgi:predicted DNA-binding protein
MTVTSLRFTDEQYQAVKELVDFYGVSVTTLMRETILERIENENDYNDGIANLKASHGKTVSREKIIKHLGM